MAAALYSTSPNQIPSHADELNCQQMISENQWWSELSVDYRSGTVNSKSFVGKVLLRIKRKFELTYAL